MQCRRALCVHVVLLIYCARSEFFEACSSLACKQLSSLAYESHSCQPWVRADVRIACTAAHGRCCAHPFRSLVLTASPTQFCSHIRHQKYMLTALGVPLSSPPVHPLPQRLVGIQQHACSATGLHSHSIQPCTSEDCSLPRNFVAVKACWLHQTSYAKVRVICTLCNRYVVASTSTH